MTGPLTFPGVLDELAGSRPEDVGVIDDVGQHTWRDIRDESLAVGRALLAAGVRSGDRVAALMRNRARWLSCAVAAARAGAVFVPLNTFYRPRELAWTLRHTRACVLLTEQDFLGHQWAADLEGIEPALRTATPGELAGEALPHLRTVVYTEGRHPGAFRWSEFLNLGDRVSEELPGCHPEDPAFVLYTSGSSGAPKGVVLSHGGVLGNSRDAYQRRGLDASDRIWLGSPLFYGLGATNVLPMALLAGATLVIQDRFRPEDALDAIAKYECTTYCGTSNMTRRIVESPAFRPERLATLVKGNTGIGLAERELVLVRMGIKNACVGYGATETCGMSFIGNPDDPLELKINTGGYLMPGFEAVVVDPVSREPVGAGELGLLKVRGHVALGYLDNAEQNAEAFDEDGFYWTGDLGWIGADGYFRWVDRVKEMIKTGGINVSPAEVEQLLLMHPAVAEAYVLGVPDRVQGEVPAAFVVTEAEAEGEVDAAALQAHVAQQAARFKVPHHIVFRTAEDIPRTTSGKVAKQELKADWQRKFHACG